MLISHADAQKAINSFAGKLMARWSAGGAPLHLIEDIKQELWIALLGAQKSYDETQGASFKTYFYGAMQWHMRTWARENIHRRFQEIIGKSLDAELSEDGDSFGAILASDDELPDEIVIREDLWDTAMAKLKPATRTFMEILRDPPPSLLAELDHIKAKSVFAKSRGIPMPFSNRITSKLILDLMGVSKPARTAMMKEVILVSESIERVSR